MAFKLNDLVEICKKEEGFSGVYYTAILLAAVGRKRYLVRYENRFNEDGSRFLTEAVDSDEIRPSPPQPSGYNFAMAERVEAFVDFAWRVGTVIRKVDPNYYVKLDCNGKEHHCPFFKVRRHLEWQNGTWLSPATGSTKSIGFPFPALDSIVCKLIDPKAAKKTDQREGINLQILATKQT
ncbi:protein AGENET DOMAIN (AGD)-CONTAINING P1 isoform X1 [Gossypium raimondii]|uniref:Agenet domain-containing protein n=1 Tax=Gossypium darwinii TaxID=34276 RepID=A0A5D2CIY3_GOSDA|nr:protein AGENET DOMAIN (AGD)-CONTAINING P1 isoform X1 [Gossypium raimondii]TYG68680.1 hypothetical protein ES288_D05G172400v1 [Gossypium darwinii]